MLFAVFSCTENLYLENKKVELAKIKRNAMFFKLCFCFDMMFLIRMINKIRNAMPSIAKSVIIEKILVGLII